MMGWANCGEDSRGRPIGYAWEATCDRPGCNAKIDRGLAYACGGMHGNEALGGDPDADWTATYRVGSASLGSVVRGGCDWAAEGQPSPTKGAPPQSGETSRHQHR
jgi:hypothetical protein